MNEQFEAIMNELIFETKKNTIILASSSAVLLIGGLLTYSAYKGFTYFVFGFVVFLCLILILTMKLRARYKKMIQTYQTNRSDVLKKLENFKQVDPNKTKNRIILLSHEAYKALK